MRNFLWVLGTINRKLVILFQFTEHVQVHCASLISYTIHSSYEHLIYKLQIFVNSWEIQFHCLCLPFFSVAHESRMQYNKNHWMSFYSSLNMCDANGSSYLMNYSNLKCEKYLSTFGRYSLFWIHYYLHFYLSISLVISDINVVF